MLLTPIDIVLTTCWGFVFRDGFYKERSVPSSIVELKTSRLDRRHRHIDQFGRRASARSDLSDMGYDLRPHSRLVVKELRDGLDNASLRSVQI